jgi:hypothetical protein
VAGRNSARVAAVSPAGASSSCAVLDGGTRVVEVHELSDQAKGNGRRSRAERPVYLLVDFLWP